MHRAWLMNKVRNIYLEIKKIDEQELPDDATIQDKVFLTHLKTARQLLNNILQSEHWSSEYGDLEYWEKTVALLRNHIEMIDAGMPPQYQVWAYQDVIDLAYLILDEGSDHHPKLAYLKVWFASMSRKLFNQTFQGLQGIYLTTGMDF